MLWLVKPIQVPLSMEKPNSDLLLVQWKFEIEEGILFEFAKMNNRRCWCEWYNWGK